MRMFHDFIYKLPNTQTDFGNGGIEHIIDNTRFKPFPESFHDVQLRTVRRQKHQLKPTFLFFQKRLQQLRMMNSGVV